MTKQPAKRPVGRPRLISSPEEMQERINDYFHKAEEEGAKPATIAGLCYFLGFDDRDAMADYEKREEYTRTVKNARLKIEQDRSERLLGKDTFTPGVIFDLKNNHGWKDKTEHEVSGGFTFKGQDLDDKL